jgi:hypothetical protein
VRLVRGFRTVVLKAHGLRRKNPFPLSGSGGEKGVVFVSAVQGPPIAGADCKCAQLLLQNNWIPLKVRVTERLRDRGSGEMSGVKAYNSAPNAILRKAPLAGCISTARRLSPFRRLVTETKKGPSNRLTLVSALSV